MTTMADGTALPHNAASKRRRRPTRLDDVLMLLGNEMAHVSTALSRSLGRPVAAA